MQSYDIYIKKEGVIVSYYQNYIKDISYAFGNSSVILKGIEIGIEQGLQRFAEKVETIKKTGGLIFFCGNGASCTMAEHMSHDFFQNALVNTQSCAETAHITAISNDISYDYVFAYRINRVMTERDMLVTVSSSGNSPNVVKAVETAKGKGIYVVTFSGKDAANKSRKLGDLNFYIPLATYGMVESAHAMLLHICLDYYLDSYMGGRH